MSRKPQPVVQAAAVLTGTLFFASVAVAATAVVTSGNDAGPESLREALASGADTIYIRPAVGRISIDSTLSYEGTIPLRIVGGSVTIEGTDDFTLLQVSNGADLTIRNLHFVGIGGFSVEAQSTGRGKGIFIDVPEDRTGVVTLKLINVSVSDVAYHGIHVSDCDVGDACGSGEEFLGTGSPAGVDLKFRGVGVYDVGYGVFDADGVRVDERDAGGITMSTFRSEFIGAGADGIELDENGEGDVVVSTSNTRYIDNGGYCDPIDPESPPYLDDLCVEDDDGDLVLDLDDALDIDEGGDGSIRLTGRKISLDGNYDEGLDLDESGDGDIQLNLVRVDGELNNDEAIKASEEDAGDLIAKLRDVTVLQSLNNDGIEFEETGNGDVIANLRATEARRNDGSGIEIVQTDEGYLEVVVFGSVATENGSADLKVESDTTGTLKVRGSDVGTTDTKNVDQI
ncbi:MAG: hypothetical protein WBM40_11780 [Thiohalocapsa sp.]